MCLELGKARLPRQKVRQSVSAAFCSLRHVGRWRRSSGKCWGEILPQQPLDVRTFALESDERGRLLSS